MDKFCYCDGYKRLDRKKCCQGCYCHKDKDNHHDNKKKDMADLRDFEFYTLDPNVEQNGRMELPEDVQTAVASVTIEKLKRGNLVWLNGVFGLDSDSNNDTEVFMRIFKGTPPVFTPGNEIYRAKFEIDNVADDDNVIEPLAHVDVINQNDKNVTYTVTLEPRGDEIFLSGPVTFTAAVIKKD